jgi:hypothetical protein
MSTSQKKAYVLFFLLGFMQVGCITDAQASCVFSKPIAIKSTPIGNMLSWATVQEQDNALFMVEKSVDGMNFSVIGQVNGAVTSTIENSYAYLDLAIGTTKVFYRLQQVDVNGTKSQTPITVLNQVTTNNYMITGMSAPTTDSVFAMTLRASKDATMHYFLQDQNGNTVKQGALKVATGVNKFSIDISAFPIGTYRLDMNMLNEKEEIVLQKIDHKDMPFSNYAVQE